MSKSPHDRWFKLVFDHPEIAGALIRKFLPERVAAWLDFTTARDGKASLVGADLTERHADLVIAIDLEGSRRSTYAIVEHKSHPDRDTIPQLRDYVARVRKRAARLARSPGGRAPAIFAFVLYHGLSPWSRPDDAAATIDAHRDEADALAFLVDHPPITVIQPRSPRTKDLALNAPDIPALLGIGLLGMGCVRDDDVFDAIRDWARLIRRAVAESGPDPIEGLMCYLLAANPGATPEALVRVFTPIIGPEARDMGLTAGQKIMQEGREEGLAAGREEGLAAGRVQGAREAVGAVLIARFGRLSAAATARVLAADADQLRVWLLRAVDAPRLEDVFRDGSDGQA